MRILVIDAGGTHVKALATGQDSFSCSAITPIGHLTHGTGKITRPDDVDPGRVGLSI